MKINEFKVEQWMTKYEGYAKYNLTDTCAKSFSLCDLLNLESLNTDEIILDYGEITGDTRLKKEILKLYTSGTVDNITVAQGCSQANDIVIDTLLNPKDHVISFSPGYQQYFELPALLGCEVRIIETKEENNWIPDIDEIKGAIQENTKMIIFNNPNNPTGFYLDDAYFKSLIDICSKKKIYILCDEVYKDWSNPVNHSISDLYELGISTSSLSKYFGLAGLRLGWIKANLNIIEAINIRRDYSIISTGQLIDALAKNALKHADVILKNTNEYIEENKKNLTRWLKTHPKFHVVLPKEGTVCFLGYDYDIPSNLLCERLLFETGVFFVPGICFDMDGYLRFGLAKDPKMIQEGLEVFGVFMQQFEK